MRGGSCRGGPILSASPPRREGCGRVNFAMSNRNKGSIKISVS